MDREGSGIETLHIVQNIFIMVHCANSTAENILHATDSLHDTTVLIHSDQVNRLLYRIQLPVLIPLRRVHFTSEGDLTV